MRKAILKSLLIRNFKCFTDLQVPFGKLTVLSGYNGTGKSTAYQPILLLSQAMQEIFSTAKYPKKVLSIRGAARYWPLNGELVRLGSAGEVLCYHGNGKGREISIEFEFGLSNGDNIKCMFDVERGKNYLTRLPGNNSLFPLNSIFQLCYISAVREVSDAYPMPERHFYPSHSVGADGRFAGYLYDKMTAEDEMFRANVDDWMDFISPGARALVQPLPKVPLFSLEFRLSETTEYMKPANVGYGLTYVFPIIVALLAAKKGNFVIVDSPEAHLHPKAQSRVGQMLASFASKGVQIVVETHSDHVLNGIRLAVMKKKLKPEDLKILFFSGPKDSSHGVITTRIDKSGRLSDWPKGFFDQIDIDTSTLLGFDLDAELFNQ